MIKILYFIQLKNQVKKIELNYKLQHWFILSCSALKIIYSLLHFNKQLM